MSDVSAKPLPLPKQRLADTHKGDYGQTLIVGGSLGMAGAPAMAAMACLRSGAGLVSVAVPRSIQQTVASYCPAYMTHALADDGEKLVEASAEPLSALIRETDAAAVGPGIGRSPLLNELITTIYQQQRTPLVIDADGLNSLAERRETLESPGGPRVLTPHAGEFARLVGWPLTNPNDEAERLSAAKKLASVDPTTQTIVVLKGPRTVVTDGQVYAVNRTGNPGMATGGSGDVLTGMITALLAQGFSAFDAARTGVAVHGLAGDLAAAKLGEVSLIATDLIDHLPKAWLSISNG